MEFVVLQSDRVAFRAAHVRRRDAQLEGLGQASGELAHCLAFARAQLPRTYGRGQRVVLVTPDVHMSLQDSMPVAHVSDGDRERWSEAMAAAGLELAALYPLAGCPLGALVGQETALCVQVESRSITVMAIVDGRCTQVDSLLDAEPTPRLVQQLVGADCPEVLLCGGGADLSALGYALARPGTTWVRMLRPPSAGLDDPRLAALAGAARHFSGLAPAHRLAFVAAR